MFKQTGVYLLLVGAAGFRAAKADFVVYTEPPIPTSAIPSFANPSDAASWTTSVFLNANFAYNRFTNSLGSTYKVSESSASSEIAAFVSTASNYSIPAAVTDPATTTSFYSKPNWYTALPSGARAFKEQQVADQFSIVRSVIDARASKTGSTAGAVPTARVLMDAQFGVAAAAVIAVFL